MTSQSALDPPPSLADPVAELKKLARHVVVPAGIVGSGFDEVEPKAAELGIVFDPWQRGAGQVALGLRADGLYAATVGGVVWSICRQTGKTFLALALLIVLCILFPGLKVVWTAHRTRTATQAFRILQGLARRPRIAKHIGYVRRTNGEQEVGFVDADGELTGSVIMFGARETGFGRGFDVVDIEVFDEAQILTEKALDDMVAATNQSQHERGALLFYLGTPPRRVDPGEAFAAKRRKALTGRSVDEFYLEFSADAKADLDDHAQWAKANPSFPSRTPLVSMLRLRDNLITDDGWRHEGLGIWDEIDLIKKPITAAAWRDTAADVVPEGPRAFFVTVARQQTSATINVAALHNGRPHVELAEHWPGVMWLTGRLRQLQERNPEAVFAAWAAGPAKAWKPLLAEPYPGPDGGLLPGLELELLSATEASAACAHLEMLAGSGGFTHSDDEVYVESLRGAEIRALDGGSWMWDWARSTSNPAPVAGAAGALWLLARNEVITIDGDLMV